MPGRPIKGTLRSETPIARILVLILIATSHNVLSFAAYDIRSVSALHS